jgi:hypothetical protein
VGSLAAALQIACPHAVLLPESFPGGCSFGAGMTSLSYMRLNLSFFRMPEKKQKSIAANAQKQIWL